MTLDQIEEYLFGLNHFASRLGASIEFTYNWPPVVFGINGLPRNLSGFDWVDQVMRYGGVAQDIGWDENKINLYFTGNIFEARTANGATSDPDDRDCMFYRHFIYINDQAGPGSSNPGVVNLGHHVLEHEMGHFLLRERSGTNLQPRYDGNEHDPSPQAWHLMKGSTPHGAFLTVEDAKDIKTRVVNGGVVYPCN